MNGNDEELADAGGEEVLYEVASHNNDMTQDVIEWDESNNVDLRYIVPSPHPSESKASTPKTDSSKTSTNPSLFVGNDTKVTQNPQQEFSKVNLDGSFQQASDPQRIHDRSKSSKRHVGGVEREIDGILDIVQKESHQMEASRSANDPNVLLAELQTQPRHNKRRATAEIQRHRSHPQHHGHRSSTFSVRYHRRRIELMEQQLQKQQQQRRKNSINLLRRSRSLPIETRSENGKAQQQPTPQRHSSTPSPPGTASGKNDGFLELLEALNTPADSEKKQPSRPPLGFVDKNVPQTETPKKEGQASSFNDMTTAQSEKDTLSAYTATITTERNQLRHSQSSRVSISPAAGLSMGSKLSHHNTESNTHHEHPPSYVPPNAFDSSKTGYIECSHANQEQTSGLGARNDKDEGEEFDDVSLSANDLAVIDSVVEASLENPCKQEPTGAPTILESLKSIHIQAEGKEKHAAKNESDDEFEDFPMDDVDFSKIDAMVATKTSHDLWAQREHSKVQNISGATDPTTSKSKRPDENINNDDDDDDFEDLTGDIDFGKIDALVASQSVKPSSTNRPQGISNVRNAVASTSNKSAIPHGSYDDEFDDFPTDINFSDIYVVVESQRKNEVFLPNSQKKNRGFKQMEFIPSGKALYPRFSRYRVARVVDVNTKRGTKTIAVFSLDESKTEQLQQNNQLKTSSSFPNNEDGLLHLCGDWYFTAIRQGDVIHISSLTGRFPTDKSALPITLDSFPLPGVQENDLVLVLHPDKMMSPSIISEAAFCNRRAVLKAKLGSTGLTSKSALVGTLVHGLFEKCLTSRRFDTEFARVTVENILRENAESLIGCNALEHDVKKELLGVVPTIQEFAAKYTSMIFDSGGDHIGGVGLHPDIMLEARRVHSVEEGIVSVELGLKGNVDAVLEADIAVAGNGKNGAANHATRQTSPQKSLICLELKTGHNQTAQNAHLAQLSLYIMMLQSRYGINIHRGSAGDLTCVEQASNAAQGGVLLYLNEKARSIYHISPTFSELKTLIGHRNNVVDGLEQACIPRGISLSYDDTGRENDSDGRNVVIVKAPPTILPELKDSSHSCKRCFSNRECMLYAASGSATDISKHGELMSEFTGHLQQSDLDYFREWNRLIDIESDTTSTMVRYLDHTRFELSGESFAGLVFDPRTSHSDPGGRNAIVTLHYRDDSDSNAQHDLVDLAIGSQVIVGTEAVLVNVPMHRETIQRPKAIKFPRQSHILKGTVDKIATNSVSIACATTELALVRELVRRHHQDASTELFFRIDTSPRSVGTGTLRWNLVNFLTGDVAMPKGKEPTICEVEKKTRLPWLRDVIIRLKPPEFDDGPPPPMFAAPEGRHMIPGCNLTRLSQEFLSLNEAQQQAVRRCMNSRDYTLIQGLPGTGKSSILTFLARLLVAQGKRVLISAYTHSAVDNIMLKLIEKGMGCRDTITGMSPLVRLGQNKSCHKGIGQILYTELAKGLENGAEVEQEPTASSLQKIVSNARIVGITALSLPRSSLLQHEDFDVVILDEAGQISQPASLGPLMSAKLFILVGDHKQLPPLVNSEIAERAGFGISMLSRLAEKHPSAIAPLTMQYRMNEHICKISSEAFYGGKMKCGDDKIKDQRLVLPGFPSKLAPSVSSSKIILPWLRLVIDPQKPVIFVDTDQITKRQHIEGFQPLEGKLGRRTGGSTVNTTESILVMSIMAGLIQCGLDASHVGVISPFRAQIKLLEENPNVRKWKRDGLELSTIDKYQGRDKSAIILSMVRSNKKGCTGRLLQDPRRLNVALTRAKYKMIIVGSFTTLCSGSPQLKPILNRINRRNQRIIVPSDGVPLQS